MDVWSCAFYGTCAGGLVRSEAIQLLALVVAILGALGLVAAFFGTIRRWFAGLVPPPSASTAVPNARGFVGREDELREIGETFARKPGKGVVLRGFGGRGKSTLARAFLHLYEADYNGRAAWISAAGPCAKDTASIIEGLCTLGAQVGLARPETLTAEADAEVVFRHIAKSGERWLIVFDSAETPKALEKWCARGRIDVIATTRTREWPDARWHEVEVGVLKPTKAGDPAAALLMQAAGEGEGRGFDEAVALAEALDRLPLALVVAGARLRNDPAMGFAAFRTRVADLLEHAPPVGWDYEDNIYASVSLSLVALEAERADCLPVLHVLAFLAADELSPTLFDALGREAEDGRDPVVPDSAHAGDPRASGGRGAALAAG